MRFDKPLGRTREYVAIVRRALAREPLEHSGEHWRLPLPDGPGKALRLSIRPVRERIPVYLAAVGPKNLELAGEIADGWLAVFFSPEHAGESMAAIATGRTRAGSETGGFDVVPTVPVVVGDDLDACADPVRAYAALYVGGMGSREQNFYNRLAVRMGYAEAAARVQDLYLGGRPRDAAAAVPLEFLDATSLLGPRECITERLHAYAEAGVTTLSVAPYARSYDEQVATLRTIAEALDASGLGD